MTTLLMLLGGGDVAPPLTVPANTVAPTISGDTDITGDLTATSDGTWTGNPAPELARNWQRDGSDISGQTSTTFAKTVADTKVSGNTLLRLRVRGTNSEGNSDAYSDPITIPPMARPSVIDVKTNTSSGPSFTMVNSSGDLLIAGLWRNPNVEYGSSTVPTHGGVNYTQQGAFRVGAQNGKLYTGFAAGANEAHAPGAPGGVGNIVAVMRGVRTDVAFVADDAEGTGATASLPGLSFTGPREIVLFLWAETAAAITPPTGFEVITDADPTGANYTQGGIRRFCMWRSTTLVTSFAGATASLGSSVAWGGVALAYAGVLQ